MLEVDKEGRRLIIGDEVFKELFSEEQIQKRVRELGKQITADYTGKFPIIVGVLNGSIIFMSDLLKNIDLQCEIDFIKLSSYGDAKISSGKIALQKKLTSDITDRNVIIVEDIVDTGLSISYMKQLFEEYNPASVKVITFLLKPESIKKEVKIDYIGHEIEDRFVLGYGMDYAQKYRNLKSIFVLDNK